MKANKEQKKKNKPIPRAIKWIFLLLLFCVLIFMTVVGVRLIRLRNEAAALVEEKGDGVFRQGLTTMVYGSRGETIAVLNSEKDAYYMELEDIPYMVKQIFLVTEDRSFYEHSGVDYKSVLRALIELVKNEGEITQGGSTITQQLARNIYLSHEVTLQRKLSEVFIAWELEDRYSKDEILEFYINNIYFANGLYGVEAAAKGYFSRPAAELTLSELCFICAIPNNPETYNPMESMDNTLRRRDRILKQLLSEKIIDGSQYEEAVNESITLSPGKKVMNNYAETFVRYSATRELMRLRGFEFKYVFSSNDDKQSYTEEYNRVYGECNSLLFTGGYRIYTSIDMEKQRLLQDSLDAVLGADNAVNDEGTYELQGSAVSIDNANGYVVAAVGGREQDSVGYTLNRAYQSFRQPGSSIKPVLIYVPLFERGYTPDSVVVDERISGGPVNSPNVYAGSITVRTALALSKNTVAWKLFDMIGCNTCIRYLLNMQFSHIVREDYVPAMSIGGMTYGVSALEMASAYAALENNGIYREPTCIIRITDAFGNVILDNGEMRQTGRIVYQKNASLAVTSVLQDVLNWGTGKAYQLKNAVCAGKTGTTNDNKDCWFAGYSRYYTTAVWCGYDMPKTLEGDNVRAAGNIWHDYMEAVHENLEKKEFDKYEKPDGERNEIETTAAEEKASGESATEESTVEENTEEENTEEENTADETADNETIYTGEDETSAYEDYTEETPYMPETSEGDGIYVETY